MKVWVVTGGVCDAYSEWIEGVFSSKEKAEEAFSKMKIGSLEYADITECEVDNPDNQELIRSL